MFIKITSPKSRLNTYRYYTTEQPRLQYPPREIKLGPPDTRKNLSTEQARDVLVADAIYNVNLKKKKGTASQDSPENYIKKVDNPLKISKLSTFIGYS